MKLSCKNRTEKIQRYGAREVKKMKKKKVSYKSGWLELTPLKIRYMLMFSNR